MLGVDRPRAARNLWPRSAERGDEGWELVSDTIIHRTAPPVRSDHCCSSCGGSATYQVARPMGHLARCRRTGRRRALPAVSDRWAGRSPALALSHPRLRGCGRHAGPPLLIWTNGPRPDLSIARAATARRLPRLRGARVGGVGAISRCPRVGRWRFARQRFLRGSGGVTIGTRGGVPRVARCGLAAAGLDNCRWWVRCEMLALPPGPACEQAR
jgi:hypothetical protein